MLQWGRRHFIRDPNAILRPIPHNTFSTNSRSDCVDGSCELITEPNHKGCCAAMSIEKIRDVIGMREMRRRAENPLEIEKSTADIIIDHKVSSLHQLDWSLWR